MLTKARNITLALALAVAATAVPATALAKHGADDPPGDDHGGRGGGDRQGQVKNVACSDGSRAKLKVKPDDGRLEAEFEVDQNRNGVTWSVQISRDGRVVVATRATTRAPSGSFSVERKIANPAGRNRVSARATSPSGEVCSAAVTV